MLRRRLDHSEPKAAKEEAPHEAAKGEASSGEVAELVMVWGPEIGRPHIVSSECLLGRDRESDVHLDHDKASRRHARISKVDGRFVIRDLGSVNGTFVNDIRVTGERALEDGDRISLGGHHFRFELGVNTLWDGHIRQHREAPLADALAKAQASWERGEGDASLLIVDVDRMKLVNDTHGFSVGDRLLSHVLSVARELVRPEDTVARLGGDEVAIVLPGLGQAGAREVAERIRTAIAERPLEADGGAIRATVSCGVAWFRPALTRAWQVRRSAEERLFDAKLAGRNQVK